MQTLAVVRGEAAAAVRRCSLQQGKRRLGETAASSANVISVRGLHASAPALGGGTPATWNHVHGWKARAKLAAAGEAKAKAEAAADKKQAEGKAGAPVTGEPLPGEKVLTLDESLPDGALEEYFASIAPAMRQQVEQLIGGGEGSGGAGRRRTVKKHMLFGWNYKSKKGATAASGEKAAGAGDGVKKQQKAAAAAAAGGGAAAGN